LRGEEAFILDLLFPHKGSHFIQQIKPLDRHELDSIINTILKQVNAKAGVDVSQKWPTQSVGKST
jgi:hypothetical protein